MEPYQYTPLEGNEIRLVILHPGKDNSSIQISISHTPFDRPEPVHSSRLSLDELQKSVPEPWKVYETVEGDIIYFCRPKNKVGYTSWDHPDPDFPRHHYETVMSPDLVAPEPKYDALSYTWGLSGEETMAIEVVNEQLPKVPRPTIMSLRYGLNVRPNLLHALEHLRDAEKPRTLWIDAICIDQKNLEEKDQQIQRMGDIFRLAQSVVVWLGPSSQDSSLAIRTLRHLGQQIEYTKKNQWVPAPSRTEKNWWKSHKVPYDGETWQAIINLMLRPWFERLWTVQEIQLANRHATFHCGSDRIQWYHLRRALRKCRMVALDSELIFPIPSLQRIMDLSNFALDLKSTTVDSLLKVGMGRACSDPRDKIYALMGLFPDALSGKIRPQYSSPVKDTYMQAFLGLLRETRRLEHLLPQRPNSTLVNSWLPDWSTPSPTIEVGLALGHFFCSGESAAEVLSLSEQTLEVTGVSHDVIVATSEALPRNPIDAAKVIHDFQSRVTQGSLCATGEPWTDAFIWTLALGVLRERVPESTSIPNVPCAKAVFQELLDDANLQCSNSYDAWITQTFHWLAGSRFFITARGYIGCGAAAVHDKAVVLLGCRLPVLLRAAGPNTHHLVGRCYTHGIMRGKALLGPLPPDCEMTFHRPEHARHADDWETRFWNSDTGENLPGDPRLGALPGAWVEVPERYAYHAVLGRYLRWYRDEAAGPGTGMVVGEDPRLRLEELKKRGVRLETFCLV
ncbi:heterokaryon incompatibility protein-domain-containing protein [Massariosphaeria phaeospora]|uniref:Heterokaryon incompatibility protein-domain-containing protein n=1 Tax=Massariosphaeria phaeospora TaxID=100035 RepID=A0A7C8I241_9PLEO|nr:heterokaryon incompatibility protein-domain-containing protein [Massariosphaeria phaeospora]